MTDKTEAQTIADLAVQNVGAKLAAEGCAPLILVPEGNSLECIEHTMLSPVRPRGTIKLFDVESFIDACEICKHVDGADIYGRRTTNPGFVAVFNDHGTDGPGWRDWRATYDCPQSIEWATWMGSNGKARSQVEFARFIEDNLPDVVEPASVDMLEISRTLEAKKKVAFKSGIRLSDGQNEFAYEEQIEGTASKGRLKIPETFVIGIPVLEGGPKHRITARLRYRIGPDGNLALWYDLERPHKDLEFAVAAVWERIEKELGAKILHGDPGPAVTPLGSED